LASDRPPKYERRRVSTSFTPFEPLVRALLEDHPETPATVIAERVGWTGSITWFRDNVRRLRPEHRRPEPADRLTWAAGDAAQCDLWFPPRKIPLEDGTKTLLPVLVLIAQLGGAPRRRSSRSITADERPSRRKSVKNLRASASLSGRCATESSAHAVEPSAMAAGVGRAHRVPYTLAQLILGRLLGLVG
jgi:hypothetical protein